MRCLIVVFVLSAVVTAPAHAGYVDESFTGTTAPGWVFVNGQGNGPSLTAATKMDPDGDGWLRLTDDVTNQSSFVYYDTPIPTNRGLVVEFDFVIWNMNPDNANIADGFAFAIFDATVAPDAGAFGGSLGYAQRKTNVGQPNEEIIGGLAGAVAGFGFDEFGNFSLASEGREGGPGQRSNSIAIRGAVGATRNDGYEYITGVNNLPKFSTPQATSRVAATVHAVRITIPTSKKITIEWKPEIDADYTTLLDEFQCSLDCPENIKIGFTSGTGWYSAYHEIRNLEVRDASSVPEPGVLGLGLVVGLAAVVWRWRRAASIRIAFGWS
jgi:MSHA biogenesis protein MshQ